MLAHVDAPSDIEDFSIGGKCPESDHLPIWSTLDIHIGNEENNSSANFSTNSGGFKVDPDKHQNYADILDMKLDRMTTPTSTWTALQEAIVYSATQTFGIASMERKGQAKGLPHKKWYDLEYKQLWLELRHILDVGMYKKLEKKYNALTRKKKRQ